MNIRFVVVFKSRIHSLTLFYLFSCSFIHCKSFIYSCIYSLKKSLKGDFLQGDVFVVLWILLNVMLVLVFVVVVFYFFCWYVFFFFFSTGRFFLALHLFLNRETLYMLKNMMNGWFFFYFCFSFKLFILFDELVFVLLFCCCFFAVLSLAFVSVCFYHSVIFTCFFFVEKFYLWMLNVKSMRDFFNIYKLKVKRN